MDDTESVQDQEAYAEILVPQRHVKRVKTALETRTLFNKTRKITRNELASRAWKEPAMNIFTNIPLSSRITKDIDNTQVDGSWQELKIVFDELGFVDIQDELRIGSYAANDKDVQGRNPVLKALKAALDALPPELWMSMEISVEELISAFPASYTIYRPILLLPHNAFTSPPWTKLLEAYSLHSPDLRSLWKRVAAAVGVTHIAVNAGIPLHSAPSSLHLGETTPNAPENILRSPANLTPIYGSFGPFLSSQPPTPTDFENALWVQHTQNGTHQTWAPLYTMFSRGNIREKTRLLTLPSVTASVAAPRGCTAVDLYAGIGYFAFSYKRAGVRKVLCWELNPWSIEGLRRGAGLNGWDTQVVDSLRPQSVELSEESDFLIFPHSNELALGTLPYLRRAMHLPPVRHVNCGFLPSSKLSWGTAVGMVDREVGGWVHAHENVGVDDIERRKVEVVAEMRGYLGKRDVRCEHVERVKTYAPGVLHIVFDVWVGGMQDMTV